LKIERVRQTDYGKRICYALPIKMEIISGPRPFMQRVKLPVSREEHGRCSADQAEELIDSVLGEKHY